ncbi:MAG: hypothetical protein WBA63_00415 [Thermomicrobiales bacterium]
MPKPARRKSLAQKRATRPNKAQIRAAEVRAEQMAAEPPVLDEEMDGEEAPATVVTPAAPIVSAATTTASPRTATRRARTTARQAAVQPIQRVKTLTHAQEFEFIKADLRRLLYTFGAVLVVMIALLFVIEQ